MFNFFRTTTSRNPVGNLFGPGDPISEAKETIRTVKAVANFITGDQEREGREQGTIAAAKIYQPVLENLEARQKKIIDETDKAQSDFIAQAKELRAQCAAYERQSSELADEIRSRGENSSGVEKFLEAVNRHGMFNAKSSHSFGAVMYDSWSLANYLENKMNEKRERYYKLAFEEKSRVWQQKITDLRKKIVASIKNLRNLKSANRDRLNDMASKVDEALTEYCEAAAKFNALKELDG